jgi:hypothetical protein
MFPFETPDEFISVLDKDGKEYGIIRSISDFTGEDAEYHPGSFGKEISLPRNHKNTLPQGTAGLLLWEVETDMGRMSFSMHDTYRNIARVSDTRLVLTDVDGNRFSIKDVLALDRKSYRRIELYL